MTETPTAPLKVPATLFSGFLGSGKTTIISHLIDDLQAQGLQLAYVKNEVGQDTIDEDLIRGKNILTKELLNGCICCTLVGDFHSALTEIVETLQPDRIIIEASGVGDPIAIALTLQSHPLVRRDGVVTIIDVLNYNGVLELNTASQRQAEFTDLIIFNKVEQADDQRKQQVVGYVREINSAAPIIEAPYGHVHPSLVFGLYPSDLVGQEKMLELKKGELAEDAQLHQDGQSHSHHDEDHIETFTLSLNQVFDGQKLVRALSSLPKQLFRIKGFVKLQTPTGGRMMIINGVNQQVEVSDAPSTLTNESEGKLVFIGFLIEELRPQVEEAVHNTIY